MVVGLAALTYAGLTTWQAYRAANRRAAHLSHYAYEEAAALQALAVRLNDHGFELQRTLALLFPRLHEFAIFLDQPLVAAALPWLLRRMLARPFKRR
ncbi:MAG TPA: hypothetical protein VIN39_04075 [Candidatus Dormibacteraeota bacterium]